jgi:hypothetical protein
MAKFLTVQEALQIFFIILQFNLIRAVKRF